MNKKILLIVLMIVFFVTMDAMGQGCSQCKLVAEQSTEVDEASFGTNINKGIILLMVVPYLLLFLLFRKRLKALLFKKA
jgi:hypothetical protein